ncbi:hypothetical protein SLEP1_g50406 [Rubroshorea leprosula]|uniref:Uncharacterized protein n=1 Tax=Rubroshorea leprosula TaxID=152421 RepID=A0AAV5M049_9ROSI|nr:hypothetical protein SLEP1_g50406 [Rubroshorea leprosula]
METSPKRKVKCSILQRDCNGEENQEMGFDSGVSVGAVAVGNLEMVDSLCEKSSVLGLIFGSFAGKVLLLKTFKIFLKCDSSPSGLAKS